MGISFKESESSCDFDWLGLGFLTARHEMRCLTISVVQDPQVRVKLVGYIFFTVTKNCKRSRNIVDSELEFARASM